MESSAPPHAQHDIIRRIGGGAYSHWGDTLYFSTSDGTDPRLNGRTYHISIEAAANAAFPLEVYLETINACNARCPFCPLFHGPSTLDRDTRPSTIMTWATFEKCAREIAAWPRQPATLYPHANGEPLQDPVFPRRLQLLRELGLNRIVNLHTNGQFLSEKMTREILSAGIRTISIAFDGATQAVYEAHRVRCDYERVLSNIDSFVRIRREMGARTQIVIVYVRTRDNEHEVGAAFHLFSKRLDPEIDELHDKLSSDWADKTGDGGFFRLPKNRNLKVDHCSALDNQLVVASDGKIAACCVDYNLSVSDGGFGDANQGTLLAHWRDHKRASLQQKMKDGPVEALPEKCRDCAVIFGEQQLHISQAKVDPKYTIMGSYEFVYRFPPRVLGDAQH